MISTTHRNRQLSRGVRAVEDLSNMEVLLLKKKKDETREEISGIYYRQGCGCLRCKGCVDQPWRLRHFSPAALNGQRRKFQRCGCFLHFYILHQQPQHLPNSSPPTCKLIPLCSVHPTSPDPNHLPSTSKYPRTGVETSLP
jgi:hypothetical protein